MAGVIRAMAATAILCGMVTAARAADTVTVGVIYPAARDAGARAAIETAEDIINTPHQGFGNLPLGVGQGLPNLGGAKIAVTFADDLANPSVAEAQALRLITHEHVAALIGAGGKAETHAASALAERHGVPFLIPGAASPNDAGGGKFVFRTAPRAGDIGKIYAQFLAGPLPAGMKVHSVALVFEDSDFGKAAAGTLRDALKAAEFDVADVTYPPGATELSAPVAQLRDKNPDAVIFVSRLADAILFAKTMQSVGYKPPIAIGDDAGFADPGFIASVGNLAQGLVGRSVWSTGAPNTPTAIVNDLYKAKSGHDLDDAGAQVMQGFLVLADAINRAGSTDPEAIQNALQQTDLKPEQLIVGYDGVKFDAGGQNTLAATYLTQLQGKQYVAIWPSSRTTGKLALPFKGWE